MPDPTPVSPTGETLFPPQVWRWLVWVFGIIAVVSLTLSELYAGQRWAEVQFKLIFALGLGGGLLSPGWRKPTAMLLLVCLVPLLGGCLHLKDAAKPQLIKCGTDAMQAQVQGVLPDVAKAIGGSAVDWQPQLDELVARAGGAALCALAVLVANLEVGGGAGVGVVQQLGPRPPDSVLLMRGYAYQAAHPYQLE